jgi:hypothetical protein
MPDATYLRRQAETCLRLARSTFDLATAERLRFLAADLSAKADEVDDGDSIAPHMMKGNGSTRNGESNHG